MSDFNEIIKQKVEQFDVPYNDAHWAEMEGKLNAVRTAKIRRNTFTAIGGIAILSFASYFIFTKTPVEDNSKMVENKTSVVELTAPAKEAKNVIPHEVSTEKTNSIKTEETNSIKTEETSTIQNPNKEITELKNNPQDGNVNNVSNETAPIIESETNKSSIPNADFIVYNNQVCLGEEVSFESIENNLPVSYTWNFGDGTISHEANPIHLYKDSHVFTVTLTLLNRQTGKEYTTKQEDIVTILPVPSLNFTYIEESKNNDDNILKYPYTLFKVSDVDKKTEYKWNFGNGESITKDRASVIYKNSGEYVVTLMATNSYGCGNSIKRKVTIKNDAELVVQNTFTPDGDGNNDEFIPKALQEWDVQFEMEISDKTNKLVYKTSDKNEPWNGKAFNSGSVLPKGVYLWKVITYDANGKQHLHVGKVNLL